MSRLEVVETGRRRRWSPAAKVRIVEESFSGPRRASATARRHGIATSLLFKWRKAYREGHLGGEETPTFMPAVITPEAPVFASSGPSPRPDRAPDAAGGRMEVVAASGRRVIVGADVDPVALARVLDVLEGR